MAQCSVRLRASRSMRLPSRIFTSRIGCRCGVPPRHSPPTAAPSLDLPRKYGVVRNKRAIPFRKVSRTTVLNNESDGRESDGANHTKATEIRLRRFFWRQQHVLNTGRWLHHLHKLVGALLAVHLVV